MEAGMRIAHLPCANKYLLKVLRNNNSTFYVDIFQD